MAATALAAGAQVSVWLTGEATYLAVPGRAEEFALPYGSARRTPRHPPRGGAGHVCTQCAARREITEADLLPGARIAGAASFVEEALTPDTQALVY